MSPKTKRNLSYVMVAADFFLMFIFALIMFEEMQDFGIYLFMLAFLGVDAPPEPLNCMRWRAVM